MKLFSSAQMRAADAAAAAAGVSGSLLMDAAGTAVAERLLSLFPDTRDVLVLCGKGNNGGDGYVAARRLLASGVAVEVWEVDSRPSTADASDARGALVTAGVRPDRLTPADLSHRLGSVQPATTVIVDALLGCGLDRPLSGQLADVVQLINASGVRVLAIDVPSGVAADSANLPGPAIGADATVQLAGPKLASAFYPARQAFSRRPRPDLETEVADIGIAAAILARLSSVTLLTASWCAPWLPRRSPTAHKYSAGTVTVVAGSTSYSGAAELACRGAWRGGAGLVTLVSDHRHPSAWPETVYRAAGASWPPESLSPKAASSCVVGPGLAEQAIDVLPEVLGWAPGVVVVDAGALAPDALWPALAAHRSPLRARQPAAAGGRHETQLVLTPHGGEAARLLAIGADAIEADPIAAARRLSERSGALVVLKGPSTVIAAPDGQTAVSTRGHPGMASGGTGDVLAGLVGALTAAPTTVWTGGTGPAAATDDLRSHDREELFGRVCLAVFAHGVAGERAAARHGDALIASDLVDELAGVLTGMATGGC